MRHRTSRTLCASHGTDQRSAQAQQKVRTVSQVSRLSSLFKNFKILPLGKFRIVRYLDARPTFLNGVCFEPVLRCQSQLQNWFLQLWPSSCQRNTRYGAEVVQCSPRQQRNSCQILTYSILTHFLYILATFLCFALFAGRGSLNFILWNVRVLRCPPRPCMLFALLFGALRRRLQRVARRCQAMPSQCCQCGTV